MLWLYAALNYVLSALMYSLLARFVLSFFMAPDTKNYIFRFFVRVTQPVVSALSFVTPRAVPELLLVALAAVWILMLRFVLLVLYAQSGQLPASVG